MYSTKSRTAKQIFALTIAVLALFGWLAAPFTQVSAAGSDNNNFAAKLFTNDKAKVITADGETVAASTDAKTTDRVWQFTYNTSDHTYIITNKANGEALTAGNNGQISLTKAAGANNQKWALSLENNNTFSFAPASNTAQALNIAANAVKLGTATDAASKDLHIAVLTTNDLAAYKAPAAKPQATTPAAPAAPAKTNTPTTTKPAAPATPSKPVTTTPAKPTTPAAPAKSQTDTSKSTTNNNNKPANNNQPAQTTKPATIVKTDDKTTDTKTAVTPATAPKTDTKAADNSQKADKDTAKTQTKPVVKNVNLGASFTARVKQKSSGKSIAVNSSNVELQTTNNYKEQGWQFTRNSDGSYRIVPLSDTAKSLDVVNGSDKNGTNIRVYKQNNSNAQKFFIRDAGSGSYYLMPAVSTTRVLDITGGSTKDGANVQLYTQNNSNAQKFTITTTAASTFKTKPVVSNRDKVMNVARSQIGYHEGSNNYTKYGVWYGSYAGSKYGFSNAPWCAMFVSWCGNQAGLSSATWYYHAYCPSGVSWYQKKGKWHWKSSYTPKTADIIYYDWNGDRVVDHVGLVENVKGNTVTTIEGNYSDQVKRRTIQKNASYVFGYASPLN